MRSWFFFACFVCLVCVCVAVRRVFVFFLIGSVMFS